MSGFSIKRRRGTTAQHASFVGLIGELTVDTDKNVLVVHDGATSGGHEMADSGLTNVDLSTIFTAGTGMSITNNSGVLEFSNTNTADITEVSAGAGLTGGGTAGAVTLALNTTGVAANTYGDATTIPSITVDAYGRVTNITTNAVAGVSNLTFNNTTGVLTLSTADGGSYTATINLSSFDSDDISEGSNSLFFTDTRARNAISAGTGVSYDTSTGQISLGQDVSTSANPTFADLTLTGDLVVQGTTTTINTQELNIADNNIVLNSDLNTTPTQNAGIEIERGNQTNVNLRWNETTDKWQITNDGATYNDIATADQLSALAESDTLDSVTTRGASTSNSITTGGLQVTGSITSSANNAHVIGANTNRFATVYATTFDGTALQAQYADLAENYISDKPYEPGTVMMFGGDAEVTECRGFINPKVAGVVSTNPAYLMNSTTDGVAIALKGRIPCKVEGPVYKGDLLVSSAIPGVATALAKDSAMPNSICIIGKSIEDNSESGIKLVEIAV